MTRGRTDVAVVASPNRGGAVHLFVLAALIVMSFIVTTLHAEAGGFRLGPVYAAASTSSCSTAKASPTKVQAGHIAQTSQDQTSPSGPCKAASGCCGISCHAPAALGSPATTVPRAEIHPFVADSSTAPGWSSPDTFRPPIA